MAYCKLRWENIERKTELKKIFQKFLSSAKCEYSRLLSMADSC